MGRSKKKQCFKCRGKKPIKDFYKHAAMVDGHLNKCKECSKKDVRDNRERRHRQYSDYEKKRSNTEKRKCQVAEAQLRRRKREPLKYRARTAVGNALRDGHLIKKPCEVCGDPKSQAHHEDYSKPLEVSWLCFRHHREDRHGQTVSP